MSTLTAVYATLFYVATLMLVVGLAYKIYVYATTPSPLKIPTTPAPVTRTGVVYRMFREVALFESLFKSTKWTWLFGWTFHVGLLLVLLRHLRYFIDPVWFWVDLIQPFGIYAGYAMLIGLLGLFGRRIFVDRVRYISAPSDYLMLLLLMAIAGSGLWMKFIAHVDIVGVKAFFIGLMTFNIQALPEGNPILYVHLALVAALMLIFPISKLLHAPGVFFSPSRHMVDNPREQRHLAPWAAKLDASRQ
jgi:nitrate reductase gamma subunit